MDIATDPDIVTFMNVFILEPANQQRVIDLLTEVTDRWVRHAKGFLGAVLHKSPDGTRLVMYSQWQSPEDYQAMREDPGPLPFLQEILPMVRFEPGAYRVVRTFMPD
jgi:quinol monooxygenase YgiN